MLTQSNLLQTLEAIGADRGVTYLSVPVTSGLREIELLGTPPMDFEVFRRDHAEEWMRKVVAPNSEAAEAQARKLRDASGQQVIDPSRMKVSGWSQGDYNSFWVSVMERYVRELVAGEGWEFSRGARTEVAFAFVLKRTVIDPNGDELSEQRATEKALAAEAELVGRGWSRPSIEAYLPSLDLTTRPNHLESAAAQAFSWLTAERSYQVDKFGTAADDEHTLAGLGDDSWWWQQLTNYFHRSRVLGLETSVGRQALAKFVATGCGLLESAIRVYGTLPPPGVPSGELGNDD